MTWGVYDARHARINVHHAAGRAEGYVLAAPEPPSSRGGGRRGHFLPVRAPCRFHQKYTFCTFCAGWCHFATPHTRNYASLLRKAAGGARGYSHPSKHRTLKKKGGRFEISNCQSVAVKLCSGQPRRSTNAGIRLISQKSQHQMFSVAATRYVFPSQNPMTTHDTGNGFLLPVSKCKIVHSRALVLCHGADLGYSVTDILRKVPY